MSDFIQQTVNSYIAARQQTVMVSVIISVIAGLLICFFGYKLLRVWCAILGFAAGALIAGIVAYAIGTDTALLVALAVGLITAVMSFLFYESGVFVIGFGAALNVAGHFLAAYGIETQWWVIVLTIIAAVVIGIMAVRFVKPVVIISTALSGGVSVAANILGIFNVKNWIVVFAVSGVLAILGMVYQFTHAKKKAKTPAEHQPEPVPEEIPEHIQEIPVMPESEGPSETSELNGFAEESAEGENNGDIEQ